MLLQFGSTYGNQERQPVIERLLNPQTTKLFLIATNMTVG